MSTHVGGGVPMGAFRGYRSHYGAGLGNVLSGILRHAVPLVAPAVKNISKSLINAGTHKLQNLIETKLGPSSSVKRKHVRRVQPVKRKRRTKADIFSS